MRPELDKIKYIEDYLLGNLSKEENEIFETKITEDKEFAREVEAQRILMKRVKVISLKKTINEAHLKLVRGNRFPLFNKWSLSIFVVIIISVVVIIYSKHGVESNQVETPFINPPLKGINVPKSQYRVNADSGGVITHSSGSMIYIPANAFLDSDGNIVTGDVQVTYREFNDPIDFYLAGIPMDVIVNDEILTMESAAMCEINATANSKTLKVNPDNKITLFQTSYTSSTACDLYYLDTIRKQWINRGKDVPLNTTDYTLDIVQETSQAFQSDSSITEVQKPIKPAKEDPEKYSFFITFEDNEFPELAGYKNLSFEVDEEESKYNPKDGDILWEDVRIKKATKPGRYQVTFISKAKNKIVQYIVQPVFKGDDYAKAMDLYEKKLADYNKLRGNRIKKENDQLLAIVKYNMRVDSINLEIEKRNREITTYNQKADSLNILAKERNEKIEQVKKEKLIAELNFKRCKLIQKQALTEKQSDEFAKLNGEQLLENKQLIEGAYQDNLEYIDLKDKIATLLASELVSTDFKNQIQSYDKNAILKSKEEINKRYTTIFLSAVGYNRIREKIVREFTIDGFGIWNCDFVGAPMPGGKNLKAEFYDILADMNLNEVVLVDKARNSLVRLGRGQFPYFAYDITHNYIVWTATPDDRLVYFNSFNEIPEVDDFTFQMKTLEGSKGQFNDYWQFRDVLEGLIDK